MADELSLVKRGRNQLPVQTLDLLAGFMIWVILSTLIPFIKHDIALSQTEISWVIAVPVLLGSALRIPFGYWAGKYGARSVYLVSFATLLFPIIFISGAQNFIHLIIGGIFLGVAGAIFSIGVTSLPRYFPKERQGLANGIYGIGNVGTAVTAFFAPILAQQFDWRIAVQGYIALALVMIFVNLIFGDRNEAKLGTPIVEQLASVIVSPGLWALSLFYFVTFGAFVAFTMVMPNFLSTHYAFSGIESGFLTGIFIALAAGMRVVGGWLADHHRPIRLLLPIFAGMACAAAALAVLTHFVIFLVFFLITAIFCGIGNGIVFKMVPQSFPKQTGVASGFVAMMGGFGGFFPPLILSFFSEHFSMYAPAFFLYAIAAVLCFLVALLFSRRGSF